MLYLMGLYVCITDILAMYGKMGGQIILFNIADIEMLNGHSGWLALPVWLIPILVGSIGLYLAEIIQKDERGMEA